MLAIILILGGLIPPIHTDDFPLSMLSAHDKVITGRFFDSLLLSLPPCTYAGKSVDLEYLNCDTNTSYILYDIFTVPNCNSSGNLTGSTAFSRNIGYQLTNLSNGTQYKINYKIGDIRSIPLMATTRTVADYTEIKLGSQGRSAAMVVITVILSVAMFILLISIIISMFVSPNEE
ncbi:uroplakin-2 isoform X1 [Pangasianodon hypophthalmus]|uniref:uroplakin-2 isoform X1 n=1 Tax=Pangasianodon hypophthalmus TaxID=310915 RepID=UPI000EFDBB43|nr:uroplakin-2 isoform X1 [Pangasianodon hypophthalmus]